MTIKLNSVSRFRDLEQDGCIWFEKPAHEKERLVRLSLNLEDRTAFFIDNGEAMRFLCSAGPGLEVVEFYAAGKIGIVPEKDHGAVQWLSAEDEPTFSTVADPRIFTKIAARRQRNPELEQLVAKSMANVERRLALQATELENQYNRLLAEQKKGPANDEVRTDAPGAAANAPAAEVPEQEPIEPEPVKKDGSDKGSGKKTDGK